MNRNRLWLNAAFIIAVAMFAMWLTTTPERLIGPAVALGADKAPAEATIAPVQPELHDFMEGVFQVPYRRLKLAMASEPADKAVWKAIRSDALILAEGSNLLLVRRPEKQTAKWIEFSVATRDAGGEMFKAAKAKDFVGAKRSYELMLTHCNSCHKQFDDGKNQLTP